MGLHAANAITGQQKQGHAAHSIGHDRSGRQPLSRKPPPNANGDRHRCRSPLSSTAGFPGRPFSLRPSDCEGRRSGHEAPGLLGCLACAEHPHLPSPVAVRPASHVVACASHVSASSACSPPAFRPGMGVDPAFPGTAPAVLTLFGAFLRTDIPGRIDSGSLSAWSLRPVRIGTSSPSPRRSGCRTPASRRLLRVLPALLFPERNQVPAGLALPFASRIFRLLSVGISRLSPRFPGPSVRFR